MTVGENSKNLPWVEKYRPSKLGDLVSHDDIIKTINQFMKENQLPHLLFYGPPGTGKTSTILACARQMYTPQQFNSMVLELNASDDRGIGIVRGQILSFASTRTIFKAGPKLIILDEADAMTNDAQNALRRSAMSDSEEEVQSRTVKITVVGEPVTGKIVVFVYDLTNLQSFEKLNTWISTVKYIFLPEPKKPLMALFGNKSDLEHQRAVRLSCVQKFASEHLLVNFKVSARTGEMVNIAFTNLVSTVLGLKVRRIPSISLNGKSPAPKIPEQNGHTATHQPVEPTETLIMNRKALRRIQRRASSSVCCLQ